MYIICVKAVSKMGVSLLWQPAVNVANKVSSSSSSSSSSTCMGTPAVGLQRGLNLATEMDIFGKGSGTWESARRILVLSHEDYFRFGFGATMRSFVKLL